MLLFLPACSILLKVPACDNVCDQTAASNLSKLVPLLLEMPKILQKPSLCCTARQAGKRQGKANRGLNVPTKIAILD